MKCHQAVIEHTPQDRCEGIPMCRPSERKPIGPATQYRVGAVALGAGDVIYGTEFNRCQLVRVVRVGKPFDSRVPTRSQHGDTKVIEHCATTNECLSTRIVCARYRPVTIDEQAQTFALGHPPPWLAVVDGWSPACHSHRSLEDMSV